MNGTAFQKLLAFLERLEGEKITHSLEHNLDDAIMVLAALPGERWEIEFFADGSVEVEQFISDGEIYDESVLQRLFEDESVLAVA